jgi:hypothetical protein
MAPSRSRQTLARIERLIEESESLDTEAAGDAALASMQHSGSGAD